MYLLCGHVTGMEVLHEEVLAEPGCLALRVCPVPAALWIN